MNTKKKFALMTVMAASAGMMEARVGDAGEPIRYVGKEQINWGMQDGGLRPVVGVQNYQVMRANRAHPEWSDSLGWTYHHGPVMAYWHGKFYLQNKANMIDEDIGSGQIVLYTSTDGGKWSEPKLAYPLYRKGSAYNAGYREGFFVAPNDRLLSLVRWGRNGVCAREIYRDDTMGPVHTLFPGGEPPNETDLPYYKNSKDAGFVQACDALLADDLKMPFWWEMLNGKNLYKFKIDEPSDADIKMLNINYPNASARNFGKGPTVFHRKDGAVVILWKFGLASVSYDEGKSWSRPVKLPTIKTRMQMSFGQKTDDGRYALLYVPDAGTNRGEKRYPLAVVTGDDGITFDNMLAVHGETPDLRYAGRAKHLGPSYVHGPLEGNGNPPGDDMWVTYSVSKEDIWISRIPVPITGKVTEPVRDTFDDLPEGNYVKNWNVYSPSWAQVGIRADFPGATNKSMMISDKDPSDYAKAVRIFPESKKVSVRFKVMAKSNNTGPLHVEIQSAVRGRPAKIVFGDDGIVWAYDDEKKVSIARYLPHDWMTMEITLDAETRRFDVAIITIDGGRKVEQLRFTDGVGTVERLVFRTGEFRKLGVSEEGKGYDLPGLEEPVAESVFYIDDVETLNHVK